MRWIKPLRKKLMEKHPFCYWCGIKIFNYLPRRHNRENNAATIDHYYPKTMTKPYYYRDTSNRIVRRAPKHKQRLVLSCNKCNREKGNMHPEEFKKEKGKGEKQKTS